MLISAQYAQLLREKVRAYDDVDANDLTRRLSNLDDEVMLQAVKRLGVLTVDPEAGTDMRGIKTVPEKININHLADKAQAIIDRGLCYSKQIAAFIKSCNRTDPDFAASLRTYICDLYASLLRNGFVQDDLLIAMKSHMEEVGGNLLCGAALTAIVVHMFLVCDIFKKSDEPGELAWREESGL